MERENYRDRSSDLRELALASDIDSDSEQIDMNDSNGEILNIYRNNLDNVSDVSVTGSDISPTASLPDYSSGSGDEYVPNRHDLDSDDSLQNIDDILPLPNLSDLCLSDSDLEINNDITVTRPTTPVTTSPTTSVRPISPTTNTDTRSTTNSNSKANPVWVRVYPPEKQKDISKKFKVRNPGPRECPINDPLNYFYLYFSPGLLHTLSRETNVYANSLIEEKKNSTGIKRNSRLQRWKNVTEDEMKKFLAIVINMGLTRRKNISDYWSTDPVHYIPFYGNNMSLMRFQAIHAMLHLSSRTSPPRGDPRYDPWVKVRPFLNSANAAFIRHYVPSQDLSIDESMIGMKNRSTFIVYMPNKRHARYGIKKFEIVDANTNYVLHTALYTGKDYLQGGQDPFTQKVVYDLIKKAQCLGKGYHVYTDNFYTKLPLARRLLSERTYLTGTVNKKSKELSQTVLRTSLNPQQSVYFRKGKILLVGYKQKPTRKPVYLITTSCHAEDKIIRSRSGLEAKKPIVINQYNLKMGGVDCKDKSIFHVSCTRPTRRYWKKIFFNLLDMCLLNAYILYSENTKPDKPMSRKNFLSEIIRSLSMTREAPVTTKKNADGLGTAHSLEKMVGTRLRVCIVCGPTKGRTSFWCPGCNSGVHKVCYDRMKHYWRPPYSGRKRQLEEDNSN